MSFLPRSLIIFALIVPLAILMGASLAGPLDTSTLVLLGGTILVLLTPFLLKNYHAALMVSWNAFITVFFLPGRPYLWMLLTVIGFGLMILVRALNRDTIKFHFLPSVALPLIVLAIIAYATAKMTGGVGLFAMGSDVFGGKKYFYIWFAVAAFFVLTSRPIPSEKVPLLASLFFLGGATACLSNLAYALGPNFYFMFLLFPAEWGAGQAASEQMLTGITRITGLSPTSIALASFLMMRYGLKGLLDLKNPWRGIAFVITVLLGFYSGFRSVLVMVGLITICLFFTERLYKTKHVITVGAGMILIFGILFSFGDRLPLAVQRSIAFLPIKLNPTAVVDARASLDWRLEIWRLVSAEIPQYFWLGKGFAINPTDLYLAEESVERGVYSPYEPAIIAGDYHSGPLSVIIPFGIWGVLAFLWFLFAAHRVIWRNYKYSPPEMAKLNQFLLAYFYAKVIFFMVFFGAFYLDLAAFVGLVGLSISANAGVRAPVTDVVTETEAEKEENQEWSPTEPLVPAFTK